MKTTLRRVGVLVLFLAGAAGASACDFYQPVYRPSYTPTYHPTYQEPYHPVKIYVATPLVVPVAVNAATFVNLTPPPAPPPVTLSPALLQRTQQAQTARAGSAQDARLDRMEKMLLRMAAPQTEADITPPARLPGEASGGRQPPDNAGTPQRQGPEQPPADPDIRPPQQDNRQAALGYVAGLFTRKCAQCHTGPKGRGGVQLFNAQGELDINGTTPATILAAVSPDENGEMHMPKNPDKLSPDERAWVSAWAGAGSERGAPAP